MDQLIINAINSATYIAVDTETDGLNTRKNHLIGIGIACDTGETFYTSDVALMLQLTTLLKNKKLIFWNAFFDIEMIRNNLNIDLWDELYCDVILLKHTVDEEMPFKLKEVASKILGVDSKDEKLELDASIKANGGSKGQVWLADSDIIAKYCIKDCKLTMDLFKYYSKLVKAEGMDKFFYTDEVMPLYKTVTRYLQSHGIAVDVSLVKKLQEEIAIDINELHTKIHELLQNHLGAYKAWYIKKHFSPKRTGEFAQQCIKMSMAPIKQLPSGKYTLAAPVLEPYKQNLFVGYVLGLNELTTGDIQIAQQLLFDEVPPPFNISSKLDLKKVFFDQLNEKPLTKTKLGAPQIDDAFLKTLEDKYEWVKLLRQYNKLVKIKGSYLDRILERQEDGIYYPQFFQHRTVSGRYGSDLQQLPRVKESGAPVVLKYNNQLRYLFIARPGHVLIGADYESLEPRVFAHVSGEEVIKDIFSKGHDFYSTIAIQTESLLNTSANKKDPNYLGLINKNKRQDAKVYSLGIPYGLEGFSLSKKLNVTQAEADRLIGKYFEGFPALHAWFKECDKQFKLKGVSTSEAGRKRHLKRQQASLFKLGDHNLNALELWKAYNGDPVYDEKKVDRKFIKNGMNNFKNFQIQSLAASITNRACISVMGEFLCNPNTGAKVVLQIHDEIVIEVKEEDADWAAGELQTSMQTAYEISVPLIAKPVIGKTYGELK